MSKIAEVIKLKTGYANFVELKDAYEASQENLERMAMYRPTKAHRAALERILKGLSNPLDKKFYLLSGSYGTGKSHLSLMTANILSRSSNDPELSGFYDNYGKLDPEKAKHLKNIRKDGQYLVAICDYHLGRSFEDIVMKAVFDACKAKDLDTGVETEFDEAGRLLEKWETERENNQRDFYLEFEKTLENTAPGITIDQLRSGLKSYDSNMLNYFLQTFPKVTGVQFQPQSGNIIPIIQKLINTQAFKSRFKGLAIFFDEFGTILAESRYSKDILQGFMESVCKKEHNVLFVGCIHKDFKSYADRYSKADADVMEARITTVDLRNEGIEEIIGAIVETDKQSEVWKNEIEVKTAIFDQLVPSSKELNLFPWIEDVKRIRQKILEDIYGVHPVALSCLLKLSSEIGSDVRSAFTFFAGDVDRVSDSYADFIEKEDIVLPDGKLNLYTVDRLTLFFRKEVSLTNQELRDRQKQFVNGYYASQDALRKVNTQKLFDDQDEYGKILNTILVYQLSQIPASLENIQFGLYCLSTLEKERVKKDLAFLSKKGVLFLRRESKTYELAGGTGEDPYDLMEQYISNPDLHPSDIVASFIEEAGGGNRNNFQEAKSYNLPFTEDKRFQVLYVRPKELNAGFWEQINTDYKNNRDNPSKSYEGVLVYALCEDDTDIKLAHRAVETIPFDNVAVSVPHLPQPFTKNLLQVKACKHFLPPNDSMKISAQTESRLQDILTAPGDGCLTQLKRAFETIKEGSESCWYTKGGKVLIDRPKQTHKPADMICEKLFTNRCLVKHPDLNLCHDDKWRTRKNTSLKQAVDILLQQNEHVFIDNGNPDNHGDKRYLEKVLFKGAGALRKIGSEGNVTYFSCETDSKKINEVFPLLKKLLKGLNSLKPGNTFHVGSFIQEVQKDPYGVGGTSLVLTLAHVLRGYGERLTAYKDTTLMTEIKLTTYNDLVNLVSDHASQIVFKVRSFSEEQKKFLELLAQALSSPPLAYGASRTLSSVYNRLTQWWESLPQVSKVFSLYDEEDQKEMKDFKELLYTSFETVTDPYTFLLDKLPSLYSSGTLTQENGEKISVRIKETINLFNSGFTIVKGKVADTICKVYGESGDIVKLEGIVDKWYKALSPSQRDPQNYINDEDSHKLLYRLSDQNASFEKVLTDYLANDFGFGKVTEWNSLHLKDFAAKYKAAKEIIDSKKPVVPKPEIKKGVYELLDSDKLFIELAAETVALKYALNGEDPRTTESAKISNKPLNAATLLGAKPDVVLKICSVDKQGNCSEPVEVKLINKKQKYDIKIEKDLFEGDTATFRYPENKDGFNAVLKSLLGIGVANNYLTSKQRKKIEDLLREEVRYDR